MKNKSPMLTIERGGTAILQLDLTEFDMKSGSVVFAIKNSSNEVIYAKEFNESEIVEFVIPDEFTKTLEVDGRYTYDVTWFLDGERFIQTEMQRVNVVDTVGGYV